MNLNVLDVPSTSQILTKTYSPEIIAHSSSTGKYLSDEVEETEPTTSNKVFEKGVKQVARQLFKENQKHVSPSSLRKRQSVFHSDSESENENRYSTPQKSSKKKKRIGTGNNYKIFTLNLRHSIHINIVNFTVN